MLLFRRCSPQFNQMQLGWKIWIIYLMLADILASVGMWQQKRWGVALFLVIASSQLIAYLWFKEYFGDQSFLIGFHIVTGSLRSEK
jgi:hypothetical protein